MFDKSTVFNALRQNVIAQKISDRNQSIDFLFKSIQESDSLPLFSYFSNLSLEDKYSYLMHLITLEKELRIIFGLSGLMAFQKFRFDEATQCFTQEQQYQLAKMHVKRSGIDVLRRYQLTPEQNTQLIAEAEMHVKRSLPDFSISVIDDYLQTNNHAQLKYELYKRFSGQHNVLSPGLNSHELSILCHHENATVEELKQVVSKAIIVQEKYLLRHGWFKLAYQSPEREDCWEGQYHVKPEDNVRFSHGGGFFHIIDFLKGNSLGYRLECGTARGVQVSPLESHLEHHPRDTYYAENACHNHVDYPARLTATIKAQYLDSAPNHYEAGLRADFIDKLENIVVTRLDTNMTFRIETTERFKNMDLQSMIVNHDEVELEPRGLLQNKF